MESSALTFSLNPAVDGNYFATAPEIKVPEIFKTDSIFSKTRLKIKEYQANNKVFEDSITKIKSQLEEHWATTQFEEPDTSKQSGRYWNKPVVRSLDIRLQKNLTLHDRNLKEYQIYASGLALNNPRFGLLDLYKKIEIDSSKGIKAIDTIRKYKYDFAF